MFPNNNMTEFMKNYERISKEIQETRNAINEQIAAFEAECKAAETRIKNMREHAAELTKPIEKADSQLHNTDTQQQPIQEQLQQEVMNINIQNMVVFNQMQQQPIQEQLQQEVMNINIQNMVVF